jgi:cardiolipin synthase
MSVPNFISLARLVAVPLIVYLILQASYGWAFWVFVLAGVSDALDGYIAKRMDQASYLGSFLDPIADKVLLVGVYLTLGHKGLIDDLVVILVVFRDLMIVGGVFLLFIFRNHTRVEPILVSKFNTGAQLVFVTMVLAEAANEFFIPMLDQALSYLVIGTTIVSGAWYLVRWARQMASVEESR